MNWPLHRRTPAPGQVQTLARVSYRVGCQAPDEESTFASPLLQCACCDHFSLDDGDWEICPVCFWEDDGLGISEPDEESGPNHITLRQARANFAAFGACDRRVLPNVVTIEERGRYAVEHRNLP